MIKLTSQTTVKDSNDLSDRTDGLQMCVDSLKTSKCVPEENLLSSSHRAQVAENQTEALMITLPELQEKVKSQPWRVSVAKV